MAVTMAVSSVSRPSPSTKDRSIFSSSTGKPLEVNQAGVAGAEVVDGQPHPEIFERVQHPEGGVGVAHERGLGHLQRQRRGIQARVGEDVGE